MSERDIKRILDRAGESRELFKQFITRLKVQYNTKPSTILNYLNVVDRFLKFSRKKDILAKDWVPQLAYDYIAQFDKPRTRSTYAFAIHRFWGVMDNPFVNEFKVPKRPKRELPDILGDNQIERLVDACDNVRNRALIWVGYESSRRNHEVRGLRICDVKFDEVGALVTFHSEKSEGACMRLVKAAPSLQQWIQIHKDRDNPNAYIFYGAIKGKPLTGERFRQIVREAAKRAGIDRRVWPHLFRHTRIAEMKNKPDIFSDDDIMNVSGHLDRRQLDIYGKITMARTNRKLLEAAGLEEAQERKQVKPRLCPRCKALNDPLARYCSRCTLPLDEKVIYKRDKLLQDLEAIMELPGGREFFEGVREDVVVRLERLGVMRRKKKSD